MGVMKAEEIEAVLERIWDLHDKVSDAIHAISRAHFLRSLGHERKRPSPAPEEASGGGEGGGDGDVDGGAGRGGEGFVFVKEFRQAAAEGDEAMAEARSLNAIRTALENLEAQLEFFHTVQTQQQVERDAAIAQLEQSRIILAKRLTEHQGKKHKVIEEALAFVGNVHDPGRFVTPENLLRMPTSLSGDNLEDHGGERSGIWMQMLMSGLTLAGKSLRFKRLGGVLGNAAMFAASMLAFLHLHRVAFRSGTPRIQDGRFNRRNGRNTSHLEKPSQSRQMKHFDVLSARG